MRVQPVPLSIVNKVYQDAQRSRTAQSSATADMTILGFFFLLRPGNTPVMVALPFGLKMSLSGLGRTNYNRRQLKLMSNGRPLPR